MSVPPTFVPRKVAKAFKSTSGASAVKGTHEAASVVPTTDTSLPSPSTSKAKAKATESDSGNQNVTDYAILVSLSLSDYAFWSDPDLRRTVDYNEEGYIPLTYLIRRSPFLSQLDPPPPESALVKAIRSHAAETLDVRMLVSSPSRSAWYGKQDASKAETSGYEVRRKDWDSALRSSRTSSRQEWESRTVYVESVPPPFRSIAGIYRFVLAMMKGPVTSSTTDSLVQHISLPPHHQDRPGDVPKCKGFALVTLSEPEAVSQLLEQWPWQRRKSLPQEPDIDPPEVRDARKYGFRVLSKARWDELKEEYLAYRQRLLDDMNEAARQELGKRVEIEPAAYEGQPEPEPVGREEPSAAPAVTGLDLNAPYPLGCLVFVRHVHPETNKTTLRTLFSQAFTASGGQDSASALDYVDFNKGMDTCYLRLASPQYTQVLLAHFRDNSIVQAQGLDSTGGPLGEGGRKAITIEIVDGKREELYWGKVPEKVRRQAVEKAVKGKTTEEGGGAEPADKGRRRKRIKRGD